MLKPLTPVSKNFNEFEALVLSSETITCSNRSYPALEIIKATNNLDKQIKNKITTFGTIGLPENLDWNILDASHIVKKVESKILLEETDGSYKEYKFEDISRFPMDEFFKGQKHRIELFVTIQTITTDKGIKLLKLLNCDGVNLYLSPFGTGFMEKIEDQYLVKDWTITGFHIVQNPGVSYFNGS